MITVQAALPGADPATIASTVAAPLERRLGQISGVSEITSVSTLGGTAITIQFNLDRTADRAARDVQAAINAAAGDLPLNLPAPPTYRKVNPADAPIMILAMTSETFTPTQIYDYADTIIGQRLSQVEGVSQVFISGAAKEAIRVQVNPAALASAGLSMEDVRAMLVRAYADVKTLAPEAATVFQLLQAHPPHIVPGALVLSAGVAETDDQLGHQGASSSGTC